MSPWRGLVDESLLVLPVVPFYVSTGSARTTSGHEHEDPSESDDVSRVLLATWPCRVRTPRGIVGCPPRKVSGPLPLDPGSGTRLRLRPARGRRVAPRQGRGPNSRAARVPPRCLASGSLDLACALDRVRAPRLHARLANMSSAMPCFPLVLARHFELIRLAGSTCRLRAGPCGSVHLREPFSCASPCRCGCRRGDFLPASSESGLVGHSWPSRMTSTRTGTFRVPRAWLHQAHGVTTPGSPPSVCGRQT